MLPEVSGVSKGSHLYLGGSTLGVFLHIRACLHLTPL